MKASMLSTVFLGFLFSIPVSGQYALTQISDPNLSSVNPANAIISPDGKTIFMKNRSIYVYTDQLEEVIECEICNSILDIAFVGDTMIIANEYTGLVKKIGDDEADISSLRATRLIADVSGQVFGLHFMDGIITGSGTQFSQMTTSNSNIPTNDIYDLAIDNQGVLWLATQVGLVSWNGNTFSTKPTPSAISAALYDIEIDLAGNIWVASALGGVAKYSQSQWTTYSDVFDIVQAVENLGIINGYEIWTSDNGIGLYRFSGTTFELISYEDLDQSVWHINRILFGDNSNRLWVKNDFTPLQFLSEENSSVSIPDLAPFSLFPNPTNQFIFLNFNSHIFQPTAIRIFNIHGMEVYYSSKQNSNSFHIDISDLPVGVYTLTVTFDASTYSQRFFKS